MATFGIAGQNPFANYSLGEAYDEMFSAESSPRAHYQALYDRLLTLPAEELRRRKQMADQSF